MERTVSVSILRKTALGVLIGVISGSLAEAAVITTDWVDVEDAGNSADNSTGGLYGAVDHSFRIARNETTIGEYATFLNCVASTDPYALYDPLMSTNANTAGISRSGAPGTYTYSVVGAADRPITYVSWFDAARFVNWMENGQGSGSTETGAYSLLGATSGTAFVVTPGATFRLPSEDEWYKAAYYDPSKGNPDDGDNYWSQATQSDTLVDNSTSANYHDGDFATTQTAIEDPTVNRLTAVGSYADQTSYYDTFDQAGNVWEWNDSVLDLARGARGGGWFNTDAAQSSSSRDGINPARGGAAIGFRIAGVPEPCSTSLLSLASLATLLRRRRS